MRRERVGEERIGKEDKLKLIERIGRTFLPKKTDYAAVYVLKALIRRYHEDDLAGLGGQLAYFFIISLFPFLMLLNYVLNMLNYDSHQITRFLARIVPENILDLIEIYFDHISKTSNSGIFTFGLIIAAYTASKAISALLTSLNRAFHCERGPGIIRSLVSFVLVFFILILIFTSLVFLSVGGKVFTDVITFFGLSRRWGVIWRVIRWAVPIAGMVLVNTALYLIIPDRHFPKRFIFAGALFSTFLWIGMGLVLSYYTEHVNTYSLVYGTLGAIMIMLIFLYWSGIVIVLGGELAHILAMRAKGEYGFDVKEEEAPAPCKRGGGRDGKEKT